MFTLSMLRLCLQTCLFVTVFNFFCLVFVWVDTCLYFTQNCHICNVVYHRVSAWYEHRIWEQFNLSISGQLLPVQKPRAYNHTANCSRTLFSYFTLCGFGVAYGGQNHNNLLKIWTFMSSDHNHLIILTNKFIKNGEKLVSHRKGVA